MQDRSREQLIHNPLEVMSQAVTGVNAELAAKESELRESKVSLAIEKYLGKEYSDKCKLTFWLDNHAIDDELAALIRKNITQPYDQGLVLGEINVANMKWLVVKQNKEEVGERTFLQKLLNPGHGADPDTVVKYSDYLREFVAEGVSFVTTDAEGHYFFNTENPFSQTIVHMIDGAYVGSLFGVLGQTTLGKEKGGKSLLSKAIDFKTEQITRRDFLKLSGAVGSFLALGSVASSIAEFNSQLDSEDVNTDLMLGVANEIDKTGVSIEEALTNPIFVSYNRGVVEMRNQVMALNTWNTLARTINVDRESPLKFIFMAGAGHAKSYAEFLSGPEALTEEIKYWTDRLCGQTLDYLLSEESGLSIDQAKNVFTQFAVIFSEPCMLGDFPLSNAKETDPKSASDLLLLSMDSRLKELTLNRGGNKEKIEMLIFERNLIKEKNKSDVIDLSNLNEKIKEEVVKSKDE